MRLIPTIPTVPHTSQSVHYCWRCDYNMDTYRIWKVCVQGDLERLLALSGTSYKWLSHRGVRPSSGPIIQFPKEDKFCSRYPDFILATTCLPHISSSTVWISVKFGIPGKLFSRRIQRRMLRRTRITPYGKRPQLPKLRHLDHSGDIGDYQVRISPIWTFLLPRTFSFSLALIWVRFGSFWGRNMTFTSRIPRVWVFLLWNGPVGLSFPL